MMAYHPIRFRLDQCRALARPSPRYCFTRCSLDSQNVVPINRYTGDPVRRSLARNVRIARDRVQRCRGGVEVVLANKHHAGPLRRREIQALMKGPVLDCSVSEESHSNLISCARARAQRRTDRMRNSGRNYAVGTEDTACGVV